MIVKDEAATFAVGVIAMDRFAEVAVNEDWHPLNVGLIDPSESDSPVSLASRIVTPLDEAVVVPISLFLEMLYVITLPRSEAVRL